ncbi:hypothetical protein V5306_14040 [Escherichia coli]|uniref:hypothetical protein n=1 Tax=Escherichia coli TaxID=562 RepID=UPI002FD5DFC7
MADYAEINNSPPKLSGGGDKYFHLRNYSEYSEYSSGFFLSLNCQTKCNDFLK